ncbi:ABC transporter substrate-binding protein [Aquihabitans daechungensis]|uniref:ABC transporter substrate-binding protein n=1 Tax=Aquihabitans daechungensis TaxID=1052257 RepID=UPI003BA13511
MKIRVVALCCAFALLATACGSRLSEEELATGGGTGSAAAPSGGTGGSSGGGATGGGESADKIGTLEIPCGKGEAAPTEPAEEVEGVTADTIKIAVISDKAGQVKVPTASIEESMQAYVDWCNGYGGINGRKLELTKIDSKLFSHLEATKEACNAGVFAIVGSGSVTDNQGAQQMVDCGLVEVPAYTATAAKGLSDNLVAPLPNPSNIYPIGGALWVEQEHPKAVKKAGILASSIETATVQAERIKLAYEAQGYDFVYDKTTGVIQESYATEASEMKADGVEWVTMVSATSETAKLLRDMKTQGFEPEVVDLGQQYYDPELLAEPGSEGAIVQLNTVPFEEVDDSPALQTYMDAYDALDTKVEPTSLGVQAFSAGLLFSTAAKALGNDLTRDKLLEELKGIHEWDGGGLHFLADPGANKSSNCFMYMEVKDGKFVRLWPEEVTAFDCDDSYRYDLEDDFGGGATLKSS